jgi:hypothetical protein
MSALSARDWLLKIAQEVEERPERWNKGSCARDSEGEATGSNNCEAARWCALGFIYRDERDELHCDCYELKALENAGDGQSVGTYNDSLQTPADFVAWFRKAAELCT